MLRDGAVGIGLIALAGLYWLGADRIRVSVLEGGVGAQAVPKSLAVALAVLAVLMMLQSAWRRPAAGTPGERAAGPDATHRHLRALGMFVIGVGYLVLVNTIGYVLAIALLLLTTAVYIGRPLSVGLAGVAAAGAVLYYLLFAIFLDIPLPTGIWPALWRQVAG